ncbi:hypothetical protein GUJ93_ZPchr0009g970 [Zizania palustris]|uniref:Uncharacterized protein n=1 Tax=Zizania palustris TaxID=103762 RepID=A0A8J5UZ81_ZIZPA|nr:hypothetical protein GUJ93_ZPchr0009g970 [Zizania palustris]
MLRVAGRRLTFELAWCPLAVVGAMAPLLVAPSPQVMTSPPRSLPPPMAVCVIIILPPSSTAANGFGGGVLPFSSAAASSYSSVWPPGHPRRRGVVPSTTASLLYSNGTFTLQALRLLSVMAAIRLDDKPDRTDQALTTALLDGRPLSQKRSIKFTSDLLASCTWEEVLPLTL